MMTTTEQLAILEEVYEVNEQLGADAADETPRVPTDP